MKLVKHIANLGYGSRKQVTQLFRQGAITDAQGEVLYADDRWSTTPSASMANRSIRRRA